MSGPRMPSLGMSLLNVALEPRACRPGRRVLPTSSIVPSRLAEPFETIRIDPSPNVGLNGSLTSLTIS